MKQRKEYEEPQFKVFGLELSNPIMTSVEELKSHIDDGGDWGDPIIDPDDDIIW